MTTYLPIRRGQESVAVGAPLAGDGLPGAPSISSQSGRPARSRSARGGSATRPNGACSLTVLACDGLPPCSDCRS